MTTQEINQILLEKKISDNKLILAKRIKNVLSQEKNISLSKRITKIESQFLTVYTFVNNIEIIHEFLVNKNYKIIENQNYCYFCGKINYKFGKVFDYGRYYCSPCFKQNEKYMYD